LVLAPHPDDDVLAVGGTLAEAIAANQAVLVVFLTSGDANTASKYLITWNPFPRAADYRALGSRREKEALRSLSILGLRSEQAIFLRYPDSGLRTLWQSNWSKDQPYRSSFTLRSAPPPEVAFTPGAVYCGQDLLHDLVQIILAFRPTVIYLPHQRDAHPDHQAAALFGETASAEAERQDPSFASPQLRTYLVHAPEQVWPSPRRLQLSLVLNVCPSSGEDGQWESVPLSLSTEELKLRAVRAHLSQAWFNAGRFLASFVRSNEIYLVLSRGVDACPAPDLSEPTEDVSIAAPSVVTTYLSCLAMIH
jgi:LmbE family N-acetylglucosaminyl deacetylase